MTTTSPRDDQPAFALPDPAALREAATGTLDRLEVVLPALPAASLRLQRAIAHRTVDATTDAFSALRNSLDTIGGATATAARTVAGTARWATDRTFRTAATAVRTVVGQTRAQVDIAATTIADEADRRVDEVDHAAGRAAAVVSSVADEIDPAVDPGPDYREWTKDRLYAQAQALEIDGRSSMTKDELIASIRAA